MRARGFTLIELMVVLVIIAVVTAAVATGIGSLRGASTSTEANKLTVAVRYLYNLSVISGKTHRLVIDLDSRTYWGEEEASNDPCEAFLLPGEGGEAKQKSAKPKSGKGKDSAEPANQGNFKQAESALVRKYELDRGTVLTDVMTSHQPNPTEKGQAYVYFFPNGSTENALIHLADRGGDPDEAMTVEVKSLQGSATVHKSRLEWDKSMAEGL
jgi:general secretion pathway protein H